MNKEKNPPAIFYKDDWRVLFLTLFFKYTCFQADRCSSIIGLEQASVVLLIGFLVYVFYCTTAWVILIFERRIPS